MLTYVIRRLLYSVVVLIAASFIIFTFVSLSNDPVAFLRYGTSPALSPVPRRREAHPRGSDRHYSGYVKPCLDKTRHARKGWFRACRVGPGLYELGLV